MKNLFVLVATLTLVAPTILHTMVSFLKFVNLNFLQKIKGQKNCKRTPSPIGMTERNNDSNTEKDDKSVPPNEQSKIATLQTQKKSGSTNSPFKLVATLFSKKNREKETE